MLRRIGAAPAVDRLIVVADDAQVAVLATRCLHHAQLRAVGVLELVDHARSGTARAQRVADLGVALPQPHRLDDQIVEVERGARAQRLLVLRIDLGA